MTKIQVKELIELANTAYQADDMANAEKPHKDAQKAGFFGALHRGVQPDALQTIEDLSERLQLK